MTEENQTSRLEAMDTLHLTSEIVAAYLGNNKIPPSEITDIIREVHGSLNALAANGRNGFGSTLKPAVPIQDSITDDYIICLEDGKKLKMLKRYLRSNYDMTPDEYRAKWQLHTDYPMVAPSYAAQRSEFAKKIGLGKTARPKNTSQPS